MELVPGGKSFRGTCRSCPATTWMVEVVKRDGSIGWHPYDEENGGPSSTSHFDTCPNAKQYRGGNRPPEARAPIDHEHAWKASHQVFSTDGSVATKEKCRLDGCWADRILDATGRVIP